MNSIIDIKYDISIIDNNFIKNTKGIFSFCIYTSGNNFDKNISELYNFNNTSSYGRSTKLYLIGLLSYLSLIQKTEWDGWHVIVHTDQQTISDNPKTFEKFKQMGAIFGITTLNGIFSDINNYRGIFRINRYYPLFIKELNIPILIRDADTVFESYIINELKTQFTEHKNKNKTAKLSINSNSYILPDFINKLNNWEKMYFNKINTFKNKVVFSYDDKYDIILYPNANLSKLKWPGKESEKQPYSTKIRFLAGVLSKVGESLPEDLWSNKLTTFLEKRFKNISSNSYNFEKLVNESDEYYLTDVIYEWCKENNKAEFFKLNYVDPSRIKYFATKYLKNKYPNVYNNDKLISSYSPWGVPEKIPNKNKFNAENKKIYNIQYKSGLLSIKNYRNKHRVTQKIQLEHPEYQMNDKFFFNPLTIKNGSNRPDSVPLSYFGGFKKYNKTKKRKTYKSRK